MKILVVEDEKKVASFIKRGLEDDNYKVAVAYDGLDGYKQARDGEYNLVIMDMMLPKKDGMTVIKDLRESGNRVPVLMLTARDNMEDIVSGLDAGSDDYLTKPFAFAELLARIEALLRRGNGSGATTKLKAGDLEMDLLARTVHRGGAEIELLPREFRLLEFMLRHAGQVVTRTMLLENVWDYHFDPQTNVIDVHVSRLRQKIDKGFSRPLLHTVRGAGYCLRAD